MAIDPRGTGPHDPHSAVVSRTVADAEYQQVTAPRWEALTGAGLQATIPWV